MKYSKLVVLCTAPLCTAFFCAGGNSAPPPPPAGRTPLVIQRNQQGDVILPDDEGPLLVRIAQGEGGASADLPIQREGLAFTFDGIGQSGLLASVEVATPAADGATSVELDLELQMRTTAVDKAATWEDGPRSFLCSSGSCLGGGSLQVSHFADPRELEGTSVIVEARITDPDDEENTGVAYALGALYAFEPENFE